MKGLRYYLNNFMIQLGKLCQQPVLLAGLTLLCLFLPQFLAPAAESALSRGVGFSGISLAVTGREGDNLPQILEQFLPNLRDVSRYCTVTAMDYPQALDALEEGQVHGVLVLPEGLAGGIMDGSNPDVELIVSGDRPLESLLTLWIGQSASDLLAAVQSGIYGVLDVYDSRSPEQLSRGDVVTQINLRYISWTMNRQSLFDVRTVEITDSLPVGLHYGLSLLLFFAMAMAPFFMGIFESSWISSLTRFRCVGRGPGGFYFGALFACFAVLFPLLFLGAWGLVRGNVWLILVGAALCALFCAGFGAVCCLLTPNTGACGVVSFCCGLVALMLSGGIVPPVLMPQGLRKFIDLSPVSRMRELLATQELSGPEYLPMLLTAAALVLLGMGLYCLRARGKEARG